MKAEEADQTSGKQVPLKYACRIALSCTFK